MLHFIFFKYYIKKYPKFKKDIDNCASVTWHTSEIFNCVLQNSPEWLKVFKSIDSTYREHHRIIKSIGKKYYKKSNWNVDELIEDIMKEVRKDKKLLGKLIV